MESIKKIKNKICDNFALFECGFRPFFLLAGIYAVTITLLWVGSYRGTLDFYPLWLDPIMWHGHEMVFGFTIAVISGFLLTAVPNWTSTNHLRGIPLIILAIIWCAGRYAMNGGVESPLIMAGIDLLFLPSLIIALIVPLSKASPANKSFIIILLALFICNVFMHLEGMAIMDNIAQKAIYASITIIMVIITIISGRVIPFFTASALRMAGESIKIKQQPVIDTLSIGSTIFVMVSGVVSGFDSEATSILALVSAPFHIVRFLNWQPMKVIKHPLLWVLYLGYFWMIVGFILLAASTLFNTVLQASALHAFTVGSIGTMTLGMMSRVALGHTGNALHVSKFIILSYVILQISVITRIIMPEIFQEQYILWIIISGWAWTISFIMFLIIYTPYLIKPRADGAKG